jgi:glutathione S-transferase
MDASIGAGPWLLGNQLSAADLAIYPFLKSLFRAAAKPEAVTLDLQLLPIEHHYAAIHRWMRRLEQMPGYERTWPPGWTS